MWIASNFISLLSGSRYMYTSKSNIFISGLNIRLKLFSPTSKSFACTQGGRSLRPNGSELDAEK